MTSAITFTLDGSLAPSDAAQVLEDLRTWLGSDQAGALDLAPLPELPQLPTQPAIQLLLAAMMQMKQHGGTENRLTDRALEICRGLGLTAFVATQKTESQNG